MLKYKKMTNKNIKFDIIGFGALNMDQLHVVDKIAGPDDESFVSGFQESCGGSAANTIIGASRLGLKTAFIGKLGQDREGDLLYQNLKKENVDTDSIIVSSGRSGRVMGFVDRKGDRALYVEPGVNDEIVLEEINIPHISKTKIIHLSSFVGDSFNAQVDLVNEIPDNVLLSFDPGRLYAEKGIDALKEILNRTNILLLNEAELNLIHDDKLDINSKDTFKSHNLIWEIRNSLKVFFNMGIDTIVVKMGDKGAMAFDEAHEVMVSCFDVECVDTTGAGDSFNAGFLYGKIMGFSLEKSCEFGNFIASKCVECLGATNGLPSISNIDLEKYEKN